MKNSIALCALAIVFSLLASGGAAWSAPKQTPASSPSPQVLTDVAYGTDPAQKMDIYLPSGFAGLRPGVALIHGGGWQGGGKGFYIPMGEALAKQGFVAFSIDYRLTPAFRYPAQVEDVQQAVRWMRVHAGEYHLDPTRIGALGDSAGGHLALFLGSRETRHNSDPLLAAQSSRVQCVVDFYGPSDLTTIGPEPPQTEGQKVVAHLLTDLFDGTPAQKPALARDASPLFSVDAKSAPTLIITGTDDPLVPVDQSTRMADALRAAGVETTLAVIYKEGHGFLHPDQPQTYGAISLEWLSRHLKP